MVPPRLARLRFGTGAPPPAAAEAADPVADRLLEQARRFRAAAASVRSAEARAHLLETADLLEESARGAGPSDRL